MRHRLTVTISDDVYRALHQKVGRGAIGRFIEELVRPLVVGTGSTGDELLSAYCEAARDAAAEREAWEWLEVDIDGALEQDVAG